MEHQDWIALVAAGVGAFAGSFLSFALERTNQKSRDRRREFELAAEALFVLRQQLAAILGLRKVYLDPARELPERHTRLARIQFQYTDLKFDPSGLSFLVGSNDGDVLAGIDMCQVMYANTRNAIGLRERAMDRVFEAATCSSDVFENGVRETAIDVDPSLVLDLQLATDALYNCVDSAVEQYESTLPDLRKVFEQRGKRARVRLANKRIEQNAKR